MWHAGWMRRETGLGDLNPASPADVPTGTGLVQEPGMAMAVGRKPTRSFFSTVNPWYRVDKICDCW